MSYFFSFLQRSRLMAGTSGLALCLVALPLPQAQAQAQAVGTVQQDRQATLQASQAHTPVPPTVYRSVFSGLPHGVETTALDWKVANANVGQFKRGHADILKWEQEQATKGPAAPANTAVKPAAGEKP